MDADTNMKEPSIEKENYTQLTASILGAAIIRTEQLVGEIYSRIVSGEQHPECDESRQSPETPTIGEDIRSIRDRISTINNDLTLISKEIGTKKLDKQPSDKGFDMTQT